jgi:cathepsin E
MIPVVLLVAFAVAAAASPVVVQNNLISLRLSKTINFTSAQDIIKSDRARVQRLLSRNATAKNFTTVPRADSIVGVPILNQAVYYTAVVGVGSPATECEPDLSGSTFQTSG